MEQVQLKKLGEKLDKQSQIKKKHEKNIQDFFKKKYIPLNQGHNFKEGMFNNLERPVFLIIKDRMRV